MQERRPITYVSIGYTDSAVGVGNHALVIGTDPVTGEQYATRAGPGMQFGFSPFGPIETEADVYNANFADTPSEVQSTQALGVLDASFTIFSGKADSYAAKTNRAEIPYHALDINSNTYAFSFSESLGFERTSPAGWTPGWERALFGPRTYPNISSRIP